MSDISGSPLDFEIARFAVSPLRKFTSINLTIFAGGEEIVPYKVVRFDNHCDYENSYKEEKSVTVAMGQGTLMYKVAPYQDDLKITLIEEIYTDGHYVPMAVEYRAHLLQDVDTGITASNLPYLDNAQIADQVEITYVSFSLALMAMEYIENASLGTPLRSTAPYAVLETLFADAIDAVVIDDNNRITNIDIYPPNNVKPMNQMVIPHGTRLIDLPDLLQNKLGGIYGAGLGFFIQNKTVFFWPTYDTDRIDLTSKRLQVILAPTKHYKTFENTTLVENDVVTILGTGPIDVIDDTLGDINATGNSIRFLDARQSFLGFGETKGNRFAVDRSKINTELSVLTIGSGLNQVRNSVSKITSNIYLELSKLSRKKGKKLVFSWRRSDDNLIVPGMPVTVLYTSGHDVMETTGTVLSCTTATEMIGEGLAPGQMITNSVMTVFINRDDPIFTEFGNKGGKPVVLETN